MLETKSADNIFFQKIASISITFIVIMLISYSQNLQDMKIASIIFLLPYFFDAGHTILGTFFQVKSKQMNNATWRKLIFIFLFCVVLVFTGNNVFNRWAIYSLGSWHVYNDERFTIKGHFHFHTFEILIPTAFYSYLAYTKFFYQKTYLPVFYLFIAIAMIYFVWIYRNRKFSAPGYYFLFFSVLNLLGIWYHEYISTLIVIITFTYFHYISWYIFYYHKTVEKVSYLKNVIFTNAVIWVGLGYCIWSGFGLNLAQTIAISFVVPATLLFHILSSTRPFKLNNGQHA
ncbi:MAG: hypothetical protein H7177_06870 [Rhizobacter sp.]|nr:hypothetical protein [Bacteriovorax sp.]